MEDLKNIEITLKTGEEDDAVINYRALWRRFCSMKRLGAILVASALVVSLAAAVIQNVSQMGNEVQTLVSFGFEGIEDGVDPNGGEFDVKKMVAPVVVQPALEETGLADEVSADSVRRATSFEGAIPQDALERIDIIRTISEKNTSALEQLLDIDYHPFQYRITMNLDALGLDVKTGRTLLDAICQQYKTWFIETYGHYNTLGNAVEVDYSEYDYSEAADLLGVQIDSVRNYITSLQRTAPNFRATSTGLTFTDLSYDLDAIESVDLAKLNALIVVNRVTKDRSTQEAYYSYQIRDVENQLSAAQERQAGVDAAIAVYERSTAVVMGDGTMPTTLTGDSAAYDSLVDQKVAASDAVANLRSRLEQLRQNYALLTDETAQVSVDPQAKGKVETLISSVSEELSECMEKTKETAQEYFETVAYKNAFQVQIPAQEASGVSTSEVIKNCFIYAAIAIAAVFVLILVLAVGGSLVSGEFYSKRETSQSKRKQEELQV